MCPPSGGAHPGNRRRRLLVAALLLGLPLLARGRPLDNYGCSQPPNSTRAIGQLGALLSAAEARGQGLEASERQERERS